MSSSKVIEFLQENPDAERILRHALEWEENPDNKLRTGWTNYDVRARRTDVDKLVFADIVKVSLQTTKQTRFLLVDGTAVREALSAKASQVILEEEKIELPKDLFSVIVGYEDIKEILKKSLMSDRPVPSLLVGPAATAKSLFLEELNRLPGSSYHLGSSSTKAGLTQFLLNMRPRILLLDELDKMSREDYAALLSLMESGKVVETKFGRRSEEYLKVWVFASCNMTKGIPPENLSRFPFQFHLREYTPEEYTEVVTKMLTQREKTDPDLAKYIAERLATLTRDVRKAIGLGRACRTREEVDQLIGTLKKYKGLSTTND